MPPRRAPTKDAFMFSFTRRARGVETLHRGTSADTRAAGLIWYEREHAYAAALARASGH